MGFVICQLAAGCGAANVLISLVCMAETRTRSPPLALAPSPHRYRQPYGPLRPTSAGKGGWNAARSQFSHLLHPFLAPSRSPGTRWHLHGSALHMVDRNQPAKPSDSQLARWEVTKLTLPSARAQVFKLVHGEFVQPSCDHILSERRRPNRCR